MTMAEMVCSFLKNCNGKLGVSAFYYKMYIAGLKEANSQTDLDPSSYEESHRSHRRQDIDMTRHELWTYLDDEAPGGRFTAA